MTELYKIEWESNFLSKIIGDKEKKDDKYKNKVFSYYLKQKNNKFFIDLSDMKLYEIILFSTLKKFNLDTFTLDLSISQTLNIEDSIRLKILNFVHSVLNTGKENPFKLNNYKTKLKEEEKISELDDSFYTEKRVNDTSEEVSTLFRFISSDTLKLFELIKIIDTLEIDFNEFEFDLFKESFKEKDKTEITYLKIEKE